MSEEMITLKMNLLGGMNCYIIENGDEEIWETWITVGVPDCATEDDLRWIAENDDEWYEVIALFAKLVKRIRAEN